MNKRMALGLFAALAFLVVAAFAIFATNWGMGAGAVPISIPFDPVGPIGGSLNEVVFEKYGPLLVVLAVLMFGAMVGGICVAREEIEKDDDKEESE